MASSPPLRWIVYGGKGWIGSMYIDTLRALRPHDQVVLGESRVDDEYALASELMRHTPTHCVCAIGRTHGGDHSTIDYLEHPDALQENVRDNLYAPIVLAEMCKTLNIHLTYVGTGCIFEYGHSSSSSSSSDGTFSEEDLPNFFGSSYSTIKGFTDRLMRTHYEHHALNVRIRMPIARKPHPRNFLSKIISYPHIHSCPNSMTVLDDALPAMIDMARRRHTGTINMVNPGVIDHHTILTMYRDMCVPEHTWTLVDAQSLADSGRVKARRSNNELDTSKLQSMYPDFPSIASSIHFIFEHEQSWCSSV